MYATTGEAGYIDLGRDILENGQNVADRTGVGTWSVFGRQLRFDLTKGFPLLVSKKLFTKAIVVELLWFLRGDTNVKFLHDHGVTIWDEWMDANGDLGPVYGKQWRSWPGKVIEATPDYGDRPNEVVGCAALTYATIDQISNVMKSLRESPHGRRHIVSAWNPAEVDDMALPPCHCLFQFYVRRMTRKQRIKAGGYYAIEALSGIDRFNDELVHSTLDAINVPIYYLDCQLYQRSADYFLGVPFNIASYALLTHMMAQQLGMVAGEFVHTFGDVHIYRNHFDQVVEQQHRWHGGMPLSKPPVLSLNKADSIFEYQLSDVSFTGYKPAPVIPAPVAK